MFYSLYDQRMYERLCITQFGTSPCRIALLCLKDSKSHCFPHGEKVTSESGGSPTIEPDNIIEEPQIHGAGSQYIFPNSKEY